MTNKIKTILISFLIILCSCDQQSSKVKYLQSEENKIKNYPFSEAVKVGDMLYLSGQIGTSSENDGGLVTGGIRQETRQTMLNIKNTLEKYNSEYEYGVILLKNPKISISTADTYKRYSREFERTFKLAI